MFDNDEFFRCRANFSSVYCCLMGAALLLYGALFTKPLLALQFIESKRNLPVLPASSHHILNLLSTVVNSTPQEIRGVIF